MDYMAEYRARLMTAKQAAALVRPGDQVEYGQVQMTPWSFDRELAARKHELSDIRLFAGHNLRLPRCLEVDPDQEVFHYITTFVHVPTRHLFRDGRAEYIPSSLTDDLFLRRAGKMPRTQLAVIGTTGMDADGYFNFSTATHYIRAMCEHAERVIVEVNTSAPWIYGEGNENRVHISEVSGIIETDNPPLATLDAAPVPTENEMKMARLILGEMRDGCCLQLGIGGIPSAIGMLIARSGLRDLGIHTEMLTDGHMEMVKQGIATGAGKNLDRGKAVFAFALGSQELYRFVDRNPDCITRDVGYTNNPAVISQLDNMISVNATLQVDLFGQANSEAAGFRQVSGIGGTLGFLQGAALSRGGNAFLCLNAAREREGKTVSNIVPVIQGIVSVPRSLTGCVVTEYGMVDLKGLSVRERARALIGIAHPDFREGLERAAYDMKLAI